LIFRKSLDRFVTLGLLTLMAIGLSPARLAADIITDIELLDKEKKPATELEKKKVKDRDKDKDRPKDTPIDGRSEAESDPLPKPKGPKKPVLPSDPEAVDELNHKSELIPEPTDQVVLPPRPSRPNDPKVRPKTREQRQRAPVHFQNAGMTTYSKDRATVLLQNSVVITQDDMRLESDDAKITLQPSGTAEGGVKTALLTGKVSISRSSSDPSERMNAKSERAIFDNQAQTVALEGNARLWREGNLIKGDRIIYEVTTGMIKVDKAQGVVQPERMKK